MSAFDDFSHRNHFPAGMELGALLNLNAVEGELFVDLPLVQFLSRFRRHWDRGLKRSAIVLHVRHAIECGNRDCGHGNRARRRVDRIEAAISLRDLKQAAGV